MNKTRCACVRYGSFDIVVHAVPSSMTISVRAPIVALPYEIELCFDKVATAIARVEQCRAAELGALSWEWTTGSRCDYFVLRRPCPSHDYTHAIERELRAIVSGTRRETLH